MNKRVCVLQTFYCYEQKNSQIITICEFFISADNEKHTLRTSYCLLYSNFLYRLSAMPFKVPVSKKSGN